MSQSVGVLVGTTLAGIVVGGCVLLALLFLGAGLRDAWQYRPRFRRAMPAVIVALAIAAVLAAAAYID
ncbi:hypothetical protein ABZ883_14735 [Streptomyces sp. NPDC046977]|uniref:hypothetical protein n=1 Tax=Streptomyces sp. NPDC046977 TaxID=3154703 RepID=UPI0033FFA082